MTLASGLSERVNETLRGLTTARAGRGPGQRGTYAVARWGERLTR